ncbi:Nif11-like leader peptide family natural product precursor [Pleurocapsales cyanobacterium LEGE 06147]|nr:Nif11-like leader peptide family natural product precursor [Pleurocapsales cyanobacterium LEGE 06147]
MESITPLDSILLPLFLVGLIFCIASVLLYVSKSQLKGESSVESNEKSKELGEILSNVSQTTDLDKFYQAVNSDPMLYEEFESLINQQDFLRQIVQLGVRLGYTFTDFEVEDSIKACTASRQGEYFCLPIGCWHKAYNI